MITNSISDKSVQRRILLLLFCISIVVVLIPIFSMDYLITLDGPNHSYSANIFYKLISGNEFYSKYISVNPNFSPNYLTAFLLGGLQTFLPDYIALKAFHIFHVLLLLGGGYYFINSYGKKDKIFPFLILPFVYSYLLFSGFYNFIFAISLIFWVIGYYERHKMSLPQLKHLVILGLFFFILYSSHIIAYYFAGLYLFISEFITLKNDKWDKRTIWRSIKIFSVVAHGILISIMFLSKNSIQIERLDIATLINRLTTGYSININSSENISIDQISWIKLGYLGFILTLLFYAIFKFKETKNPVPIITAIISLLLYFILPDSVGYASVFSVRVEYFFWIIISLITSIYIANNFALTTLTFFVAIVLTIFQVNSNLPKWRTLNNHAKSIVSAGQNIPNESIVYPVFNSLIWDDLHISNLLAGNKDILILENTQARQNYFPIIYNSPYEKCIKEQMSNVIDCNGTTLEIDYLLIVGKYILDDPIGIKLYEKAYHYGEIVYEDDFVQLLKF